MDKELRMIGIKFACMKVEEEGFNVKAVNEDPSLIPDAVLSREGRAYHLFVCSSTYPESPDFTGEEIHGYHNHAAANGAIALGCSILLFNPHAKSQEDLADLSNGISAKIVKIGIMGHEAENNPFTKEGK